MEINTKNVHLIEKQKGIFKGHHCEFTTVSDNVAKFF